ncbi:MAG: molybdopterin-dependent oxidoreductase [Bacteroidetes bacterium]|nr:molybdopterin-dependent oxidoreductase [Bacteroidota bacterium]MCW5896043.1 molybdopterin-dependent oxidoreductase [Bacteroidota bacterium]
MAKITIDGKILDVDPKRTIIEAARENGIEIPHFCWHPKLSVSGNCRMCLVEVEKMPKLAIACATQVMDGMVVHTANPKVINAREAVMEFLLINHPLDCPICDEAGECKLQDYAYKYSEGASRFDESKVHKPKRVELGPNVMLDTERCIMCSRCVRFCEEIAKKPQLTFTQRGTHVELTTFPGEQLDNPYSMNTIDICPVGALTSRDFRFKARVWEMSATETVCPGCARGCNIYSWVRNNEILRQTPRYNPEVNDYWMCDKGRLESFRHVNVANRIKHPMMKKDGGLVEVGWDEAIAKAASELKTFKKSEIAVIGSAYDTNEDNYLLQKFASEVLGTRHIDFARHVVEGDEDDLLIRADKTPNTSGVRLVGVHPREGGLNFAGMIKSIKEGSIKALFVVDDNIAADPAVADALSRLELLVVNFSFENETTRLADILFPSSTFAEKNGTFTNFEGRVQRIRPSVATLDQDRSLDGFAMSRLDKFGSQFDRWAKGAKRDARPTWKIVAGIASVMGAKYKYSTAEDVFNEIASHVEGFKGMSYRKIGTMGMMLKKKEPVAVKA